MSELDRELDALEDVVKRHLKINPGLESVERHAEYKKNHKHVERSMKEQVDELLDSNLFTDIDNAIGSLTKATAPKPDRVMTESDELEIQDAVIKNMKPLSEKIGETFADFMILVFNLGGQDFLNKHNIPATFDLEDEQIIEAIKTQTLKAITGIDDTTRQWVKDQIVAGREAGLSNSDIADSIREVVPKTYEGRADRIVRTETSHMVGQSEHVTAQKNGASHKEWVTVNDGSVCPICEGNAAAGFIGFNETFPSGDLHEPAHPNCRCLVDYQFTPAMGTTWHGQ